MKSIAVSTDANLIKSFLSKENAYDSLTYDGSPSLFEYVLKGVWILLKSENRIAGFINFEPMNNVLWQPHIYINEKYRGKGSEEWGIAAIKFMREHCGAKKFLALTPYKSAKNYAERVGFSNVGVLEKSIKKNGVLLDQHLLELGDTIK